MVGNINFDARRSTPSLSRGIKHWYVYIAVAKTKRYYTGITLNIERRIKIHNEGKGSRFARQQGGLILVYKSKPFSNKSEARKREVQIKKWSRIKKEKLIKGEWE